MVSFDDERNSHLRKPRPEDFGLNANVLYYRLNESNLKLAKSDVQHQINESLALIKKINQSKFDSFLELIGVLIYLFFQLIISIVLGATVASMPYGLLVLVGYSGKNLYGILVVVCSLALFLYTLKDLNFNKESPRKKLDNLLKKISGTSYEEKIQSLRKSLSSIERAISYVEAVKVYERQKAETGEDWWRSLSSYALEEAVAEMFKRRGFSARATKKSGDGGVDVIVKTPNKTLLIQCKGWEAKVGVKPVREMAGVAQHHNEDNCIGVILGTNGFTAEAKNFSSQSGIELWDACHLAKIARGDCEI